MIDLPEEAVEAAIAAAPFPSHFDRAAKRRTVEARLQAAAPAIEEKTRLKRDQELRERLERLTFSSDEQIARRRGEMLRWISRDEALDIFEEDS